MTHHFKTEPKAQYTHKTEEDVYFKGDLVMTREYGINHISKEPYNGQWVVRNHKTGEWVDDSRYSNDLKDKHGFR